MKKLTLLKKLFYDLHLQSLIFRRALRCALVVFISIFIYRHAALTQGYWVTLTAMLVVQPTVGATLRKGIQRFIGTILGVSIASLLLMLIHNIYVIDILVILLIFVTYYFNPFSNLINYGFIVVPLSIMVVFTMALITPEKVNLSIVFARFYDTTLGAMIGIIGSLTLFPNRVKNEFDNGKENIRQQLADYFMSIMNMLLNVAGATEQAKGKKRLVEEAILADRQFYLERTYEIRFHKTKRQQDQQFLMITEQIAHRLFSLHHLARYPLAIDLLQMHQDILMQLRNQIYAALLYAPDNTKIINQQLENLQKQLADYAKKQDNPSASWRYLAPLASVYFIVRDVITDTHVLKSLF